MSTNQISTTQMQTILDILAENTRREVRIETRLCKLMATLGLDESGNKVFTSPVPSPTLGCRRRNSQSDFTTN